MEDLREEGGGRREGRNRIPMIDFMELTRISSSSILCFKVTFSSLITY